MRIDGVGKGEGEIKIATEGEHAHAEEVAEPVEVVFAG